MLNSATAIIIVTFKRQNYLKKLLQSLINENPHKIIIVDNENSAATKDLCDLFKHKLNIDYLPQAENLGGAGGFSKGVKHALGTEATWFWLIDDDVEILPGAFKKLEPWSKRFKLIQPRRYNFDGKPFFWQHSFNINYGIANPLSKNNFPPDNYFLMNTACFEGTLVHKDIARRIGPPDSRFFIYYDDTIYGYLASKITPCAYINEFCLKRIRPLNSMKVGSSRRLGSSNNITRYYIMRNRALLKEYFKKYGDYKPLRFAIGTFLSLIKEIIRTLLVDKDISGFKPIIQGLKDSRNSID